MPSKKTSATTARRSSEPRRRHGLREAAPNWRRHCSWCGGTWPVATDGRNLLCSHCAH